VNKQSAEGSPDNADQGGCEWYKDGNVWAVYGISFLIGSLVGGFLV
jgi:hypothetical protein